MKLTSITANRHVFGGRVNGKPIRLLLTFDDVQRLRLGVAGDGFRMTVDSLPLDEPCDLDQYGGVVVEDVTQSLFVRLQNVEVKGLRALLLEGQQVGVRMLLGSGGDFHFWIDGDELFWGDGGALAAHDWLDGLIPTAGEPVQV
ncbi:MAG: hypothetical protein ABIQ32_01505 [Sphingomicrobium sp.]